MPDQVLGVDVTKVYTLAQLTDLNQSPNAPAFGTRYTDVVGKRYVFMKATTAWTKNDFIVRDYAAADEPHAGAPCSAVAQPIAGVAVSTVALNGGGWVQVEGEYPTGNVAASTAGGMLGTTATVGRATGITIGAAFNQAELQAVQAATQAVRATAIDVAAGNLAQVNLQQ